MVLKNDLLINSAKLLKFAVKGKHEVLTTVKFDLTSK